MRRKILVGSKDNESVTSGVEVGLNVPDGLYRRSGEGGVECGGK